MESDLSFAPATELRQKIAAKEVSIVELTELFYRRIEQLNPQLNAYLALCPDQALAAANRPRTRCKGGTTWARSTAYPSPLKTWR